MGRFKDSRRSVRLRHITVKHYMADIFLIYRLLEERTPCGGSGVMYSLSITQIDLGGERRQVNFLPDISRSYDCARRIYKTVSRSLVPPCTASEIVSDLIGI